VPADVIRRLRDTTAAPPHPQRLSGRQVSWLRTLAAGATVTRLADLEGYSERAMYRMLQRLYVQMGVRTRTEALMRAQALGLLDAEDDAAQA
jgi:DNA-binding NarL/FixJ family response regulator